MSRLARALVLAAMTMAGLTAAQAHPAAGDAVQPSRNDARRQALAQERYYESFDRQDPATQAALAQERYYNTWRPGHTTAPAQPAEPNRPVVVLGAVAAALALVALTAVTATRARRRLRARQAV